MQLIATSFKMSRRRWYFVSFVLRVVRPKDSVNAKSFHWFKERLEKLMEKKSFRVTKPTSDSESLS